MLFGLRRKREKCPKSAVESVRSNREKYTCLELCLSLAGGETLFFVFTVFSPPICAYRCMSVTKSCSLYNSKTLQDIFMTHSLSINHHQITYTKLSIFALHAFEHCPCIHQLLSHVSALCCWFFGSPTQFIFLPLILFTDQDNAKICLTYHPIASSRAINIQEPGN